MNDLDYLLLGLVILNMLCTGLLTVGAWQLWYRPERRYDQVRAELDLLGNRLEMAVAALKSAQGRLDYARRKTPTTASDPDTVDLDATGGAFAHPDRDALRREHLPRTIGIVPQPKVT